ncbi:MAG: hypothetical protein C0433_12420 [Cyclobacterium sp.]|nr:hypothetical protein [Cyclobacterium sp.]
MAVYVTDLSPTMEGKFDLKWTYTAKNNFNSDLKKYRMISERMPQNYLDGFCHKLNRKQL